MEDDDIDSLDGAFLDSGDSDAESAAITQGGLVILTPNEILLHGLRMFFTEESIIWVQTMDKMASITKHQCFEDHFGCKHFVAAAIWEDLQTTDIPEAKLEVKVPKRKKKGRSNIPRQCSYFLYALNYLKQYLPERQRKGPLDKNRDTLRDNTWPMLKKIQALKHAKVKFPDLTTRTGEIFLMYVDGVHS